VWYHPAAFAIATRDVIAGWLVCLAIAALFFGFPAVESVVVRVSAELSEELRFDMLAISAALPIGARRASTITSRVKCSNGTESDNTFERV
jgi:hypothetical protein